MQVKCHEQSCNVKVASAQASMEQSSSKDDGVLPKTSRTKRARFDRAMPKAASGAAGFEEALDATRQAVQESTGSSRSKGSANRSAKRYSDVTHAASAQWDLSEVLAKTPEQRSKWLAQAIRKSNDGKRIFDIVVHPGFVQDVPHTIGCRMFRVLSANMERFSEDQGRHIKFECELGRTYSTIACKDTDGGRKQQDSRSEPLHQDEPVNCEKDDGPELGVVDSEGTAQIAVSRPDLSSAHGMRHEEPPLDCKSPPISVSRGHALWKHAGGAAHAQDQPQNSTIHVDHLHASIACEESSGEINSVAEIDSAAA